MPWWGSSKEPLGKGCTPGVAQVGSLPRVVEDAVRDRLAQDPSDDDLEDMVVYIEALDLLKSTSTKVCQIYISRCIKHYSKASAYRPPHIASAMSVDTRSGFGSVRSPYGDSDSDTAPTTPPDKESSTHGSITSIRINESSEAFLFHVIKNEEPPRERPVLVKTRTGRRSYILPSIVRDCCLSGDEVVWATLSFTVKTGNKERTHKMTHDLYIYREPGILQAVDVILGENFLEEASKLASSSRRPTGESHHPRDDAESIDSHRSAARQRRSSRSQREPSVADHDDSDENEVLKDIAKRLLRKDERRHH